MDRPPPGNRRLYVDEATGEKTAGFAHAGAVVRSVLTALIEEREAGGPSLRPSPR